MRIPNQNTAIKHVARVTTQSGVAGVSAAAPFDFLCRWFDLPWCDEPEEWCRYDRTDTSCWGVVQMCKDRGWTESGESCSSGWYACGACLGFPW